ncbi:MAG: DUF4369 domain-containing protein [Prevotella sp.]|nr:DUF4369 domain-containing protein [Prevotella sp.]MBR3480527.1 DUF4369 domain-containing protein [Prevotella sp.]MBR6188897.1 DUF4369 domain-containing protein [Prevotella sp.]
MKNILYALFVISAFASCAESYTIQGSSSLALLDGNKLYLKAMEGRDMKTLDSCDVVHGKFRFTGLLDTTQMAALFMGEKSVMPIVVERGDIKVRIEDAQQKVSGSPLNEVLYTFLDQHNQLQNDLIELGHRESRMLLDGIDEDVINQEITKEWATITQREDSLVTNFVVDNFDNVLGPFIFIQMSSSVPQVEHIWSKAPDEFKQQPNVSDFYQQVTSTNNPALQDNHNSVATSPQDIDDATIQDILNGK